MGWDRVINTSGSKETEEQRKKRISNKGGQTIKGKLGIAIAVRYPDGKLEICDSMRDAGKLVGLSPAGIKKYLDNGRIHQASGATIEYYDINTCKPANFAWYD